MLVCMFLAMLGAWSITPVAAEPQGEWLPQSDSSFRWLKLWGDFVCVDDDSIELIIGINDTHSGGYAKLEDLTYKYGGKVINKISGGGKIRAIVVNIPFEAISSFITKTRNTDFVSYVELNFKLKFTFIPNDPNWTVQWGPKQIGADWAWNTTTGNHSIIVAVIDSGIDYNHPDLDANIWNNTDEIPDNDIDDDNNGYVDDVRGWDFGDNDSYPLDSYGHGTHVAGIIAAELNNGEGIAGLAQVQIMVVRVGHDSPNIDDIANGIYYAVDQGADILSLSLGMQYFDVQILRDAVKYAYEKGVLMVAAAGNSGQNVREYPAAYDEVIAVTATNESDHPAWFTTYGSWVDVAAPGVKIYSTLPTYHVSVNDPPYNRSQNYDYMSGTSMAAPHVSGVAALILSQYPNLTHQQVRVQLWYTADDLGDEGFDIYYGYGRINASRAIEQAPTDHDLLIYDWEAPWFMKPGVLAVVNTTVFNFGKNNESNIEVQLLVNGSDVDSTLIDFLQSAASKTVSLSWTPTYNGTYNVTSYVVPVPGETVMKYNARSRWVKVGVEKIIRVPQDFDTIQGAINDADPGDTILVSSGTYRERISIDKPLKIIGEDPSTTIIDDWKRSLDVFIDAVVTASDTEKVEISGFTIQNSTVGVYLYNVSDIKIINNIITLNDFGMYLIDSRLNTISNNTVTSNSAIGIFIAYFFIPSYNNTITGNTVTSNGGSGIFVADVCDNNIISGNTVTLNGHIDPIDKYGIDIGSKNNI